MEGGDRGGAMLNAKGKGKKKRMGWGFKKRFSSKKKKEKGRVLHKIYIYLTKFF